jgi:large repetitive protein
MLLLLALACDLIPDDADGDGYPAELDCNDGDADVHPGADEVCDGTDQDCDGEVDEGVKTLFYTDADRDGWGQDATVEACSLPDNAAEAPGDCDDTDSAINPDAPELCDGVDSDCDGEVDEDAEDATAWFIDEDDDGWGDDSSETLLCEAPEGHVERGEDCDDTEQTINPDADEVCNGWDDDCDGEVDVDAVDASLWFRDGDGDGLGTADDTVVSCEPPSGYIATSGDCDDSDASIQDAGATLWWYDQDGDGYGSPDLVASACEKPFGYVDNDEDCDDTNVAENPDADEICDGDDDDCDGDIDEEDAIDPSTWYVDSDNDGYGSASGTTEACDQPSGYVDNTDDCDDNDST